MVHEDKGDNNDNNAVVWGQQCCCHCCHYCHVIMSSLGMWGWEGRWMREWVTAMTYHMGQYSAQGYGSGYRCWHAVPVPHGTLTWDLWWVCHTRAVPYLQWTLDGKSMVGYTSELYLNHDWVLSVVLHMYACIVVCSPSFHWKCSTTSTHSLHQQIKTVVIWNSQRVHSHCMLHQSPCPYTEWQEHWRRHHCQMVTNCKLLVQIE